MRNNGLEYNKLVEHDRHLFNTWSERSAYLLGYLEADGCIVKNECDRTIRIQFGISEKDYSYLLQLKEWTSFTGKITIKTHHIKDKDYKTCNFTVSSREWKSFLETRLRMDKIPQDLPDELLHHYIRGYFDGDGSVYKQDTRLMVSFVGSSESLVVDIRDKIGKVLADTRGMSVYQKSSSKCCWCFRIARQDLVAKLGNWLYHPATFYLGRKRDQFETILRGG